MTRKELKKLIKETIMETMSLEAEVSPKVKQQMIARLQAAIKVVQQAKTFEEIGTIPDADLDADTGRISVKIFDQSVNR